MIPRSRLWLFGGVSFTFCVVTSATMYMRKLLEDKILNSNICKTGIDILQQHPKGLEILGPPLTFRRPNLRNTFNNWSQTDASFAVGVTGEKKSGNLLILASKTEEDTDWIVKSLELQVEKQKIAIKE